MPARRGCGTGVRGHRRCTLLSASRGAVRRTHWFCDACWRRAGPGGSCDVPILCPRRKSVRRIYGLFWSWDLCILPLLMSVCGSGLWGYAAPGVSERSRDHREVINMVFFVSVAAPCRRALPSRTVTAAGAVLVALVVTKSESKSCVPRGPRRAAGAAPFYTRLRLGGRHPLCGSGVTSMISVTLIPAPSMVRTALSRPLPGPLRYAFTLRRPRS